MSSLSSPLPAVLLATSLAALAMGCEPEIGMPCDPDKKQVDDLVEQKENTNNLVQNVALDNCSQGFCLSTDGSRPYCTKRCTSDVECAAGGDGFTCQEVVTFGPLACADFTPETDCLTGPNGEQSESPLKYCAATSTQVIIDRDKAFGR